MGRAQGGQERGPTYTGCHSGMEDWTGESFSDHRYVPFEVRVREKASIDTMKTLWWDVTKLDPEKLRYCMRGDKCDSSGGHGVHEAFEGSLRRGYS